MFMRNSISEELSKAIAYETEKINLTPQEEKPDFHVTPPVGWINDPNGFSCYQGEYHLFYQYHPYSTQWGPMHWGHCKTKDFVAWEQLPCALAPDTEYDGQGCFSGSALEDEGKHILMYTSVLEEKQDDGSRKIRQTQSIAIGDGISYRKLSCNPVITADALPEGSSAVDFRDPKIWKENDTFYAVAGSLAADGSGQIALFSAKNLEAWKFETILDSNQNRYGKMWECPDFFSLEGRQVLIVSPQFMRAEGLEFHNGNNAIYFIGEYDAGKKKFIRNQAYQIDHGLDFYAPQTVEAADGRRIMIAWMQSWDNYMTPEGQKWSGMMTIPRELSIKDGKLIQVPVREAAAYYGKEIISGPVSVNGGSFIPGKCPDGTYQKAVDGAEIAGICGRQFDMTVLVEVGSYKRFEIGIACDEAHQTMLFYEPETGVLTFDRNFSGEFHDTIYQRSAYAGKQDGKIKLRILMDKYTVEIFVNDGEMTMSSLIYTDLSADKIRFASEGKAEFEAVFHEWKK